MFKISELYEQNYQNNTPMFSDISLEVWDAIYPYVKDDNGELTDYNFMKDYLSDNLFKRLDSRFNSLYGDKFFLKESDNIVNCLATFKMDMTNEIISRINELARLYYAVQIPYNPLYNKDVRDTETIRGGDTHTHEGVLSDSKETGNTTTSIAHDAITDSGKPSGINNVSEHTQTITNSAVPYNETTEYEQTSEVTNSDAMRTVEGSSDSSTVTHGRGVKTETNHTETVDRNETRELWSRGNQGVTKSTELMRDEYDMRLSVAFWDSLFKLITYDYIAYL